VFYASGRYYGRQLASEVVSMTVAFREALQRRQPPENRNSVNDARRLPAIAGWTEEKEIELHILCAWSFARSLLCITNRAEYVAIIRKYYSWSPASIRLACPVVAYSPVWAISVLLLSSV
jgi:hypothetical protein